MILKAPLGFGLKVTRSNNKVGTIGEHVKNRKLLISEHLVINKRLLCDLTSLISTLFTLFRPYQTTISVFIFRPCKNDDTWFLKMCIRNCLIGFRVTESLGFRSGTNLLFAQFLSEHKLECPDESRLFFTLTKLL